MRQPELPTIAVLLMLIGGLLFGLIAITVMASEAGFLIRTTTGR